MNSWRLIFLQSRANSGVYDDGLPAQYWKWPQETWLQERLRYLRKNRKAIEETVPRDGTGQPSKT